jgi:hypothetical protein
VLLLKDVPKPVPKDDEVLVRVRATTVGAADCELRRFDFAPWIWVPIRLAFGIRRPRQPILGQELAGDVESVGNEVPSLTKGLNGRSRLSANYRPRHVARAAPNALGHSSPPLAGEHTELSCARQVVSCRAAMLAENAPRSTSG